MFVGRQSELEQLNNAYNSGNFECVAISGRRHMGKTSLISEFIKNKDAIYFSARELTDKYNLEAFTKTVAERFGIGLDGMQTWEEAFNVAFKQSADNRVVLVMDNYTNACLTNKELSSIIYSAISINRKNSNVFLIL